MAIKKHSKILKLKTFHEAIQFNVENRTSEYFQNYIMIIKFKSTSFI